MMISHLTEVIARQGASVHPIYCFMLRALKIYYRYTHISYIDIPIDKTTQNTLTFILLEVNDILVGIVHHVQGGHSVEGEAVVRLRVPVGPIAGRGTSRLIDTLTVVPTLGWGRNTL